MSQSTSQSAATGGETAQSRRQKVFTYALGVWMLTVVVAIANATVRELFIAPETTELVAHQISTVTLIVLLALVSYAYFTRYAFDHSRDELLGVGVLWLGLTVAFELLFGHFVAGESWASLLKNYDIFGGYIWILIPLMMLIAPLVFGHYLRR